MDSFPRRRRTAPPFRLSAAAAVLDARVDGDDPELDRIASLERADARALSLLADRRYLAEAGASGAGALLVTAELAEGLPAEDRRPRIVVEDAHRALARLLEWLHPEEEAGPGIHPTAVLGAGVRLGTDTRVGPYAVIESGARLGHRVRIGAHTVVGAGATIGEGSVLHPHVVVYPGSELGRDVVLHAGVRVGVDGFGYVLVDGEHRKVPQVGGCVLEDGVEVGANTTMDRGSIGDTRVGTGAKIDNLVQLGHNVVIGPRSILVSQAGVAGSTQIGAGVVAGGQAGITGHVRIGDGARLAARTGVVGDVPAGETYMGFPGRPRSEFLRSAAAQRKVPELLRRVRALEREMEELRGPEGG